MVRYSPFTKHSQPATSTLKLSTMTLTNGQAALVKEEELKGLVEDACEAARKKKHDYDVLLEMTTTVNTHEEKKRLFRLLATAVKYWMEVVEKCRELRKAYQKQRALREELFALVASDVTLRHIITEKPTAISADQKKDQ